LAAGSAALTNAPSWVAALLAFASAFATTAMTLVAPVARQTFHALRRAEYDAFVREARLAQIELRTGDEAAAISALRHLDERRYALDTQSAAFRTSLGQAGTVEDSATG